MAKTASLVDGFSTINPSLWNNAYPSNIDSVVDQLNLTTNTTADYFLLESDNAYDLEDSQISIEIINEGNQSLGSFEFYPLQLVLTPTNTPQFLISGGGIFAYLGSTLLDSDTFDIDVYRFLRIRESAGTVYFEYSSDQFNWNTLTTVASPANISAYIVTITVGTYANEGVTTTAIVDNLNMLDLPSLSVSRFRGKVFSARIYSRDGSAFLGNLALTSDPQFSKTINGGVGAASFQLALPFDNIDGLVDIGNEIQVWVVDRDSPAGVKVYSGFINEFKPYATGSGEGVEVVAYGYVTRASYSLLRSTNDFSISYSSQDPSAIFEDLIDKYRAGVLEERGNYSADSVEIVGTNVSTSFNAVRYSDALQVVQRLAGVTWYWYWDANNLIHFKQYPSTPTHLLTFGKEVVSLELNTSASQMVNNILFWNGLVSSDPNYIYELYRDSASETEYWHRMEVVVDERYTVQASAQRDMTARIDRFKEPVRTLQLRVTDNNFGDGYDIESIEPGHTIRVLNLGFDTPLAENMLVSKVVYNAGYIDIIVDDIELLTARVLNSLQKQIVANQATDLPAGSATVVNV